MLTLCSVLLVFSNNQIAVENEHCLWPIRLIEVNPFYFLAAICRFFMKTKEQKKETLKKISDKLSKAKIVIFTSFMKEGEKGLSVSEAQELRRSLREVESDYMISKKKINRCCIRKI